jgi:hypothetical protein
MQLFVATLLLSFASLIHAQAPPNDDCANAIVVNPQRAIPIYGNTTLATSDNGRELTCKPKSRSAGLWYKYASSTLTEVTATTCNNGTDFDTIISVFVGNDCDSLSCVATNDDSCGAQKFSAPSTVKYLSKPNQTYWVVVQGFDVNVGFFHLTVTASDASFVVIDSITDQPVALLDAFSYAQIPTSRVNIQTACALDVSPRSVRMTFDNPPRNFCENVSPFAVFGDLKGDFFNATIPVGNHLVTATPYNASQCQGTAGPTKSQTFSIKPCSSTFAFIDVPVGAEVKYSPSSRELDYLPCSFNIKATFQCGFPANEVKLELRNNVTGKLLTSRIERTAPYYLFGDVKGAPLSESIPSGTYRVTLIIDGITMLDLVFSATKPCVNVVLPNDLCQFAVPLVLNSTVPARVVGNTSLALVDGDREKFCYDVRGPSGLWYKFTTPSVPFFATFKPSVCSNVTNVNTLVNIAFGNNCDTLSCFESIYARFDSCDISSTYFFKDPNETYWISVHSDGVSGGLFELSLQYDPYVFVLVNPFTDQTMDVLLPTRFLAYYSNARISRLNILASYDTALPVPKSMRLTFDNPPINICDSTPPFSVFGDSNGDFFEATIPIGNHVVTATAYNEINCQGTAGPTRNTSFLLQGCVVKIFFYNAITGSRVNFRSNELVSLPCSVNVEARLDFCYRLVQEVKLELRNVATNALVVSRTEHVQPYYLFGDVNGNMLEGVISPGVYVLTVTVDGIEMNNYAFSVLEECGQEPPCMSMSMMC